MAHTLSDDELEIIFSFLDILFIPNVTPMRKQETYKLYGETIHCISLVCKQWASVIDKHCKVLLRAVCDCNKQQKKGCHVTPYETYVAFFCMLNLSHRAFLLKYLRRWTWGTTFYHEIFNAHGSGSTFYLRFPLREAHIRFFKDLFRFEHFDIDKFCFENVHLIVDHGIYPFDDHCLLECAFNSIQNAKKHKDYFNGTHYESSL